ncbi:hypothetical protein ACFPME_09910 [Rhodanobacter umsongensis]|uniref:Uncharacterized protein n=1 Tax=Rhodanobacter umsongensis TaxID=633153 RepID=A0ABW0JLM2_9GAMM
MNDLLGAGRDKLNIRNPQLQPPRNFFTRSQELRRSLERTPKGSSFLQGSCVNSSVNASVVLKNDCDQHAASMAEQEFSGIRSLLIPPQRI